MPELSLAELMRREDSGSTNMRSCWHACRTDLVETAEEEWWGLESPTTYPQRSSPHDGFEVLAKSSSSKPSFGGQGGTLLSCFRQSSTVHMPQPDLEPSTPPRSEVLLMQAPCSSMRSSSNVTKFMEVEAVDPHHGYSGYESDQLHTYSDEEPTSPVVNCIGQVRPKKKSKQRCNIAKKSEPGAAAEARNINESLMLQGTNLYSLQLASPMRSGGAAVVLPARRAAKCKSAGKWKQLLQRSSSASSISPS